MRGFLTKPDSKKDALPALQLMKKQGHPVFQFMDNRPQTAAQRIVQRAADQYMEQQGAAANIHRKIKPEDLKKMPGNRNLLQKKSSVVQMAADGEPERSFINVASYSPDTVAEYGEERIKRVLRKNGLRVRGHHSGAGGDGMNAATKQDIAALIVALKAEADPAPHEEKKAPPKGKGKKNSPEQQAAIAAAKAQKKKDKKAAGKEFFRQQRGGKGGRGGRGGGRGGGVPR